MKLTKTISALLLLIFTFCLAGCSKSPADTLHDAASVSENTAVSAADEKIESSSVLWGVMYFYDDVHDAICIVDNGRVITASVSEPFAMQFIVNGPYLFDEYTGTNFEYTYSNDNVLYITYDEETVYKFAMMNEEDFGNMYGDFETRFSEAMTNFAKENGYIVDDAAANTDVLPDSSEVTTQVTTEVEDVEEESTETTEE